MGKNNKLRRSLKKRTRKNKEKKAVRVKAKNPVVRQRSSPVFRMMENPFGNLSDDERKQLIAHIGAESKKAHDEAQSKIDEILHKCHIETLLAILSAYCLTAGVKEDGAQKKFLSGSVGQPHIEILQALSLQIKPEENQGYPVTPDLVAETIEALDTLLGTFSHSRMKAEQADLDDDKHAVLRLQEWVRGTTSIVRNWGFHRQIRTIGGEIFSPFDQILQKNIGFSSSNVFDTFSHMLRQIEQTTSKRFEDLARLFHIKDRKEMILAYYRLIDQNPEEAQEFIQDMVREKIPKKNLFSMLMSHYDLRLPDYYTFSTNSLAEKVGLEVNSLSILLDTFSYQQGDLSEWKAEHFFLNNPIWRKPVIKLDNDKYLLPMPQLFFSFCLVSMSSLINQYAEKELSEWRAEYLENKIETIVNTRFPEANTVRGLQWKHNGAQYETDLITFIDTYAIIVEAKSGKITEEALRGAPDRLKRTINDILIAPNEQSKRLKEKLLHLIKNPDAEDEIRDQLPVSLTGIQKILRISVSLEDFASLQANVSRIKDTGWLPEDFDPCPAMNLADFETLFDFLESPIRIIHYLERRTEMESQLKKYIGDELSFLGWYIDSLFNFGNLHEEDANLILSDLSEPIDQYYIAKDEGIDLPKPHPRYSKLFTKILAQIEQKRTPGWSHIGSILHRFSPDDQGKLETMITALKKIVAKSWSVEGHKNTLIYSPPRSSEYALVYVVYKDENIGLRYQFFDNAARLGLEPAHVKYCLVIGKNMDDDDFAYNYIALTMPEEQ